MSIDQDQILLDTLGPPPISSGHGPPPPAPTITPPRHSHSMDDSGMNYRSMGHHNSMPNMGTSGLWNNSQSRVSWNPSQMDYNQDPITSNQYNQDPITSNQYNQDPITSNQYNQDPITSNQYNQDPITSNQYNQDPITSNHIIENRHQQRSPGPNMSHSVRHPPQTYKVVPPRHQLTTSQYHPRGASLRQSTGSSWGRGNSAPPINRLSSTWGAEQQRPMYPPGSHPCDFMKDEALNLLDGSQEVVRGPLRLCIRAGTSKALPQRARWILDNGTPVTGSTTGDVWLDVQIRLLRTSLHANVIENGLSSSTGHRGDEAQRWQDGGLSEALVIELTAPDAAQFCLLSVLTPSYFQRLQVEQRITVDWQNFPSLLAEMIGVCHDNAINCTGDLYGEESLSANRGSARGSRPATTSGGRICALGPFESESSVLLSSASSDNWLDFSIIEPSSLREIVHLNLPIAPANHENMQAHLVRVLEELKQSSNLYQRTLEDVRSQSRSKEAQWQRLDTMRANTQSQRVNDLEKQVKELSEDLAETATKAAQTLLELDTKKSLADEAIHLRQVNTDMSGELKIIKPQVKHLLERSQELQSENKRLGDLVHLAQPEAIEELRMVCVSQKSLLTEFELEVSQHAQTYSALNSKINQLAHDNAALQKMVNRSELKIREFEEYNQRNRETTLNEGTLNDLQRIELKRLEIANEELLLRVNESDAARQKLSGDLKQKVQLIQFLHSELNKTQMMHRLAVGQPRTATNEETARTAVGDPIRHPANNLTDHYEAPSKGDQGNKTPPPPRMDSSKLSRPSSQGLSKSSPYLPKESPANESHLLSDDHENTAPLVEPMGEKTKSNVPSWRSIWGGGSFRGDNTASEFP